jgi:hypothetical protein
MRVISGAEARTRAAFGAPPRTTHQGDANVGRYPVQSVDARTPGITVDIQDANGIKPHHDVTLTQTGKVLDHSPESVEISRGHGGSMHVKASDFALAGDTPENTQLLLADAKAHNDTVNISMNRSGELVYRNDAQYERYERAPDAQPYQIPHNMHERGAPDRNLGH